MAACLYGQDAQGWLSQLVLVPLSALLPLSHLSPPASSPILLPQAVGATPESVMLLDSPSAGKEGTDEGAGAGALFLQVRP